MNTPLVTATAPGNKVSLLEQLPPELLHRILEYVLPYGLTFTFEKSRPVADNSIWILFAARGKHAPRAIANKPSTIVHAPHRNRTAGYSIGQVVYGCDVCEHPYDCEYELRPEDVCTELALLYVDKAIAREARGESQNNASQMHQLQSVLTRASFHFQQEHLQFPHHWKGGPSYLPQIAACIRTSWLTSSYSPLARLETHRTYADGR